MGTYSVNASKSISGGTTAKFTMPSWSVPSGEVFYRYKITIVGGDYTGYTLQGDTAGCGWNVWNTDTTKIHWTGGKSYVWVSSSTTRSVRIQVTFETKASTKHTITINNVTGGTLTANKSSCSQGYSVTLSPSPATGYQLSGYTTSPTLTITNNQFTMPNQNVTITPSWTKINYTITKVVSPSGAGTISGSSSAQYGSSVTLTQTPASGYYFAGWSISGGGATISGGTFTMPAANVTVTATYLKYSTATVNTKTATGGSSILLTINASKTTFTHKYKLSFGTNMETSLTSVSAGVTSVNISIPAADWAEHIPTATQKTGGTLILETYNGSTKIGTDELTGFTYKVQASAIPIVSSVTTSIARTIGTKTYANVGNYYVQNHCGVRVQASASGVQGSTISSIKVTLSGHTHTTTVNQSTVDWTSGLLYTSGTITVTVTATDSRGRTGSNTATITVTKYNAPSGTLSVWRCDAQGQPDDTDEYGKFSLTKSFTQVGSNALTVKLTSRGTEVTLSQNSGDLLPGSRQTFSQQSDYTITLKLTDSFSETTTITTKLPSAKFIIFIDSAGNRMAFFKAVTKSVPTGKNRVLEISSDTQVFIGDDKLEEIIPKARSTGTFTDAYYTGVVGFITTSGTLADIFIPMQFSKYVTSINITKLKVAMRHVSGGYLSANNADLTSFISEVSLQNNQGGVRIQLVNNNGWGITNNTPIMGTVTMNFTLS